MGVVACTVYHGCWTAARKAGFCTSQNKNGIYARRLIHAVRMFSLSSAAARSRPAFPRSVAWMGRYAGYFEMKSPKMSGAFYSGCLRIFLICKVINLQSYNAITLDYDAFLFWHILYLTILNVFCILYTLN